MNKVGHSCGVLFGGNTNDNANAGLTCANAGNTPSNTNPNIGSHLCLKKQYKRMTALPLGKKYNEPRTVLVGMPAVWATEDAY